MAERVYPADSPPESGQFSGNFSSGEFPGKPNPPPATYVIQVPKDQIYRIPPPENAHRLQHLSKKKASRCRCCFCSILATLFILTILVGISLAILYLVLHPETPRYSVEEFSVTGINLTSSSPISPRFNITVRSRNGNGKIGVYYQKGSSMDVYFDDADLCNGGLPAFYQPANNVTVIKTTLTGSKIQLTSGMRKEISKKTIPFKLKIRAPVKFKVGSVKTWTITVKVNCDITVDKLTPPSRIVSRKCSHDVDIW